MITVRKSSQPALPSATRPARARRKRDAATDRWLTFYPPQSADSVVDPFGNLLSLKEVNLRPGAAASWKRQQQGEILTYVREGSFAHEDSHGGSGVICAGEFHLLTAGCGLRRGELNASLTDTARAYQICLRAPDSESAPVHQQQRFSVGQRRGHFCLVASCDARLGSLRIHQDALIYSALLEPGQHVVHEMSPRRCAWLHVVDGAVTLAGLLVTAGNSAEISHEPAVSVTAQEGSELLLVDVLELSHSVPEVPL